MKPNRVEQILSGAREVLAGGDAAEVGALYSAMAGLQAQCQLRLFRGSAPAEREPLLTMPEAAACLGVPEWTAREMGRRGEIPTVRMGRTVRVEPAELRKAVEARRYLGPRPIAEAARESERDPRLRKRNRG